MGAAALVLGIVGLLAAFVPFPLVGPLLALLCCVLAIVFGATARKKGRAAALPTGVPTAGMVLGIIGVCLSALSYLACQMACSALSCGGSRVADRLKSEAAKRVATALSHRARSTRRPARRRQTPARAVTPLPTAHGGSEVRRVVRPSRVWTETFAGRPVGSSVQQWGRDLQVVRGSDGRRYLTSRVPGQHRVRHTLTLGTYFVFEIDWTYFDHRAAGTVAPWVRVPFTFRDQNGRALRFECGNWGLRLPGRRTIDFSETRINRLRVERRGDRYRFFNNGRFLASGTFAGYGSFVSFSLVVPVKPSGVGQRFTRFHLAPLTR